MRPGLAEEIVIRISWVEAVERIIKSPPRPRFFFFLAIIYNNKMHSELRSVSFDKCICKWFEITCQSKARQDQALPPPGVSSTAIRAHVH